MLPVVSARAAPTLGSNELRSLIVMEDRAVTPVAVEQLQWLGQGGIIASGWYRWPDQPALAGFEIGGAMPPALKPVHFFPRFGLSPDGGSLVTWHRLSDQVGGQAQLTLVDLVTGNITPLGSPQVFLSAGRIVTPAPGVAIAAVQPEGGGTILLKGQRGSCEALVRFDGQTCEDLVAEPDGDHVIAVCSDTARRCYRINWRAGVWAEVEAARYEACRPTVLPPSVQLDQSTGRLVRLVTGGERVELAEGVEAACGREGSGAIIYASRGSLWVTDSAGEINRRLWGARGEEAARASLLSWSPDGVYVAHCYRSGDQGWVRRAALGTEIVKVRLSFPEASTVKAGDSVWVAERFSFDGRGEVVEPVWPTLKALLRVEQVTPAEQGKVVDAESVGTEGGVVERLTGSNDPPGGRADTGHIAIGSGAGPPAEWMQTFTAEPRANLSGWARGDRAVARLLSVVVTRRRLMSSS
ncbi:MAG TPA: hypothetical protein VM283_07850 [Armatimonadota bacterium]|nr:hypothetical protein [Armatimonadota bacterium]